MDDFSVELEEIRMTAFFNLCKVKNTGVFEIDLSDYQTYAHCVKIIFS